MKIGDLWGNLKMASAQTTEAAHYAMSQRNATKAYYASLLDNPNVQRGLNVIRTTEGTAKKKDPYATAFGGGTIKSLRDHPRKSYSFTQTNGKKNKTTAAGAYQFLSRTWDGVATKLGLKDFTKKSQDIAALALIDARQGLDALLAGDIRGFISAVGPEWASLPTAPDAYSQPRVGWNKVQQAWDSTVINAPGPISPEAIAAAYRDPSRALDIGRMPAIDMPARPMNMTPVRALNTLAPPRSLAPAPVGRVDRAPLGDVLPSVNAVRPTSPTVGRMPAAPAPAASRLGYGTVNAVRPSAPTIGRMPAAPARSLAHPVSSPRPSNLDPAPVGAVTKGPALAPAALNTRTLAEQYGQYRPSTATSMPTVATPPSVPVGKLPAAPAQPLQHPISVPVAPVTPPALALPPAPVLAPELVPRPPVQDRPIYQAPAPPRATAYDVYSGMADTALDNTGLNTVSSMPGGGTSVTNKYGATTGMTPGGYQTAVGSLPGITGPTASRFGGAIKGALPGMAGASLGGLLGGPVGALLGAALAKAVSQPGGLLSGQASYAAPGLPGGVVNAARPQSGGAFPSAPSAPSGQRNVRGWDSAADRARGESISPGASAAIGRNQGGLY
jgi:muramidase (phage lysozyme)